MTSLGIVPGINFFVSGHFLILFIDLTNLPEALCVQKICRGIIHFDPTSHLSFARDDDRERIYSPPCPNQFQEVLTA